jgi:adenine-specific DNA-methyltransferase
MLIDYKGKKPIQAIPNVPVSIHLEKTRTFQGLLQSDWQNMLILGDNFSALKLLLENPKFKGNVRLVYIDPPFSTNQVFRTGNGRTATISRSEDDSVAYRDILTGPEYLEFLRERLILLKKILASDGTIYIHIDCKMGHYVKIIMDEIFGPERFINDITRIKCNPKNFDRKGFGNVKDMILFYSKTSEYIWNDPREDLTEADVKRLFTKLTEDGRHYTTTPLHAPGETKNGPTGKPWRKMQPPKGRHWRYPPKELEALEKAGLIEWSPTGNPRKIIYADDVLAKGKKRQDVWEFKDPAYPTYPTEKNIDMLRMIIETSSNPDDMVLDCFAGSGTTMVAAEITGRRWVGIDNSEAAIKACCDRLRGIREHTPFTLYRVQTNKGNSDDE